MSLKKYEIYTKINKAYMIKAQWNLEARNNYSLQHLQIWLLVIPSFMQ